MCGIAGIFAYGDTASRVDPEELLRIREAMRNRGPDGAGLWISADERLGLAHRRLAIIDIGSAGAQPMSSADGGLRITFNGEIYNYRELRRRLEAKGYRFRSNSDTEVLLHLYDERGESMVHALRGMYALGIWDERRKRLFLARDPLGIKPLYYADDGEVIRFASQVKALIKGGAVDTAPEPAGSVGFLVWGSVPEPYTLYREIRSLPAGAFLSVSRDRGAVVSQYFSVSDELRNAEQASVSVISNARDVLKEAVSDSVRHHLISDVPVGLFLSAGLDSTTLAGLASAEATVGLRAVTLGFREFQGTLNDEVPIATAVAKRFGISHETHWITRTDFEAELPKILESMDQPTIDGVNTYFVSRAAAASGMKVALSGVGGDELFGGYPSFSQVPKIARFFRFSQGVPSAGRLVRRLLAIPAGAFTSTKYASAVEYGGTYGGAYLLRRALYMPWEVRCALDDTTVRAGLEKLQIVESLEATFRGLRRPQARIAALELCWYMRNQLLRDADWAGMAHSVEIRVPLVDVQLLRALAPLMVSDRYPTKLDFARVLSNPLPNDVMTRRKSGFVTPVQEWLLRPSGKKRERGLREWAKLVLPPQPRMFRALALVSDAFGGTGGIAKYNRDLLESVARVPECAEVVAVPRVISEAMQPIPPRVRFLAKATGSKLRFIRAAFEAALGGQVDLLICAHINLAPLCAVIALLKGAPSILFLHGVDAWTPHRSILVRMGLSRFNAVVCGSEFTLRRFVSWAAVDPSKRHVLPNCVDLRTYSPGSKPAHLERRLKLNDRTVLMTLGRLESQEQLKGFDEVIDALPALADQVQNISYLICGDGNDRDRLEKKVKDLTLGERVVFAGFVPEAEKADYYRLADAYVMPSRGEGFGIVFLEALACGVPVMASRVDGGCEALSNGDWGCLVDPSNPADIVRGVLETLNRGRGNVQEGLGYYSRSAFTQRAAVIVKEAMAANC